MHSRHKFHSTKNIIGTAELCALTANGDFPTVVETALIKSIRKGIFFDRNIGRDKVRASYDRLLLEHIVVNICHK